MRKKKSNTSHFYTLFLNHLSKKGESSSSVKADPFYKRVVLCERFKFNEPGEKISNSLTLLYVNSIINNHSKPSCFESAEKTAEEVYKILDKPAESALPEPTIRENVSEKTLTNSELFESHFKDTLHAIIKYPKQGYENLTGEHVDTETHTVYFGHDLDDWSKCLFFDPDMVGGASVKAPCEVLIPFICAQIASRYKIGSTQSPVTTSHNNTHSTEDERESRLKPSC